MGEYKVLTQERKSNEKINADSLCGKGYELVGYDTVTLTCILILGCLYTVYRTVGTIRDELVQFENSWYNLRTVGTIWEQLVQLRNSW